MLSPTHSADPRLPFPTRLVRIGEYLVEEFIIPDDKRAEVLAQLYPFRPIPNLDAKLYDLHADKTFIVKQYRVTYEFGMNYLVSPYYFESGGTVIDWLPLEPNRDDLWEALRFDEGFIEYFEEE